MGVFTSCAEPTISAQCGPQAVQLLHSLQQHVVNATQSECNHDSGNGHTDVAATVSSNPDCKQSQQQKYADCQNVLDQLTSHLEFFHFSYPFAPTDSYKNFTETCAVYNIYRNCMESVKSCYAQDSSLLFMKVTVGVMCDAEMSGLIGKEIQNGPTSCIRSTSSAGSMQLCLSNYSNTFDANVNDITASQEPTGPFCRILSSLATFASCAEPILSSACGPTAHKITEAFSDYSYSNSLHSGCKKDTPTDSFSGNSIEKRKFN